MLGYPETSVLLRAAREALIDDLLPLLPEGRRLDALVIANVLAIAAREAAEGEAPFRAGLARLCALYGEAAPPADLPLDDARARFEALSRRLAADLRSGAFDGAAPERAEALRSHLVETTLAALRANNPRYLEIEGLA